MDQDNRPVEIKDLNKTQLILLAILLSFVTSIATGIVTVTLMQQASPGTTQTINRVVQQTIEKVVPDYSSNKGQTVIIKEGDLVVNVVTKTRTSIFPVSKKDGTEPVAEAYFAGNGVFLVGGAPMDSAQTYSIEVGTTPMDAKVTATSSLGFSLLTLASPALLPKDTAKVSFATDSDIKPGETVVSVTADAIRRMLVQSIDPISETDQSSSIVLYPKPDDALSGAVVVNLDGNVVGMVTEKGDTGVMQVVGAGAISGFMAKPSPLAPAPVSTATPPVAQN